MFSDPKKNIEQSGIHSGMKVADIGAGSGFHTFEASKLLVGGGTIYAIDVQKELLDRIKNRADKENISNIEIILGDVEKQGGTKLADKTIDICLLCNILFQLEDKKNAILEMKRILVPGGKILLIDWSDSFGGLGPHKNTVVKENDAIELFEQNGFSKEKNVFAGAHHYGMILKKL